MRDINIRWKICIKIIGMLCITLNSQIIMFVHFSQTLLSCNAHCYWTIIHTLHYYTASFLDLHNQFPSRDQNHLESHKIDISLDTFPKIRQKTNVEHYCGKNRALLKNNRMVHIFTYIPVDSMEVLWLDN